MAGRENKNRQYKDSVFVDLFSEDERGTERFLSLYNALHGTQVDDVRLVENIRLEKVMYMSFSNDVSYLVEGKIIVLAEHQSTVNPNMPLRCLEYIARLYEKHFQSKEKYSRKLLKLPTPEFYVFYNGREEYPCDKTLTLSEAFIEQNTVPNLELIVKVVNINQDKRNSVLEKCKALKEYSLFVETVRRHVRDDKEGGFQEAIKECIANNILREYLQRKAKEVINMLVGEYDYETDIAVQREEGREIGFAEGIARGIEQGIEHGKSLGRAEGFARGTYQTKQETARKLLQMGLSERQIREATGLSEEEIKTL